MTNQSTTAKEASERREDAANDAPVAPKAKLAFPFADVIFGAVGVILGLPTLLYPFGRDQGLYYYVAREWVARGSIPYKEVLDHKTPGIYVIHALSIVLFGQHQWSIRVLEILAVLGFGFVLGSSLERVGKPIRPGARGAGMFMAALMYFGYFDFWNTAQSEIWYSGFGICALWAAKRIVKTERAAFVIGVFAGLVALTKPPGATFVIVAVVIFALRLRREGQWATRPLVRHAGLVVGGVLAPIVPVMGYFAIVGALPAMKDIVVGANAYYVSHEAGAHGTIDKHVSWIFNVFAPLSGVFFLACVVRLGVGIRKKTWESVERDATGLALVLAAIVAVAIQGKYYLLHWGCLSLPLVYLGLATFDGWSARFPMWARHVALAATMVLGYAGTALFDNAAIVQRDTLDAEWKYHRGVYDARAFHHRFQVGMIGYYYADSYDIGKWLEAHTSEGDNVTVRGFQPEIYAVANRRHRGRFFWTTFLTSPFRLYRREEWLAEDARDLELYPPKYLVALSEFHEGLDSAEFYEKKGYVRAATFPGFVVLASPAAAPSPTPP